jgi:hypothetical protein
LLLTATGSIGNQLGHIAKDVLSGDEEADEQDASLQAQKRSSIDDFHEVDLGGNTEPSLPESDESDSEQAGQDPSMASLRAKESQLVASFALKEQQHLRRESELLARISSLNEQMSTLQQQVKHGSVASARAVILKEASHVVSVLEASPDPSFKSIS